MTEYNPRHLTARSYHIPFYARQLEVKWSDGVLGIDMGGLQRQIRLFPSSISHGPIEPGQMTIDYDTGGADGGTGVRARQYKTERDQIQDRMDGAIVCGAIDLVIGAAKWVHTPT